MITHNRAFMENSHPFLAGRVARGGNLLHFCNFMLPLPLLSLKYKYVKLSRRLGGFFGALKKVSLGTL